MNKKLLMVGIIILIATFLLSSISLYLALDGNIGSNLLVSGLILIIIGVFT